MGSSWCDGLEVLASVRMSPDRTGLVQSVFIDPSELPNAAIRLNQAGYHMEDVSVVDTSEGFLVVYHFDHFDMPGRIALRVLVAHESPEVPSLSGIFSGADWHERECRDFFGITFVGHRNLIPLLLPEDADIHPLVKEPSTRKPIVELLTPGEVEHCSARFEALMSKPTSTTEGTEPVSEHRQERREDSNEKTPGRGAEKKT